MSNLLQNITNENYNLKWFYSFVCFILALIGYSILEEKLFLAAFPLAIIAVIPFLFNYRNLYFLFWAVLPFSIEYYFGGFGTDLPTEPIMLALSLICIVVFFSRFHQLSAKPLYHPISLLLIFHLLWIVFTSIFSQTPFVSYKWLAAKIWYVIPFYFASFHFLKDLRSIKKVFRITSALLTLAVIIVLFRHAMLGFTFQASHEVVRPIFRNHVNYAAILVVVLPFIIALYRTSQNLLWKRFFLFSIVITIIGVYFSYTRAAQLCLVVMVGVFFVIHFRLAKLAIISSSIIAILLVSYLVTNNKYMDYAPDFESTVMHTKFDNLLEATYKMEDLSTMERVYRWVAGTYMIKEKPFFGHGPGTFYFHYKKYTVKSFETYVSDNPEKSGIHSYYLMTIVEQGVLGLLIFLGLCFTVIMWGQRMYHRFINKPDAYFIAAATISFVIICTLNIINDLLETDKVGPFFFLNASIIVIYSLRPQPTSKS